MMRPALDRLVGALSRLVLRVFFRRIEVVGAERLVTDGPLLLVANHVNGLIDALFVFGPLGQRARMLGKSTLWRIPGLASLLDLAGAIPVHRRKDVAEGADPSKNLETFARCHEALARGERIALFPEGISHDEPRLQPLRTGAARIALEAERRFGPLGVRIQPVGLVFEARHRFRSRALVVVGEPIDPAPERALAARDENEAVRTLTARLAEALERVTLNYRSWEDARLIELGARVVDRRDAARGGRGRFSAAFEMRRALADGLVRLRREHPREVAAAAGAALEYEEMLRAAGVSDEQVAARPGLGAAARFVGNTLARLTFASPVAAIGTLLNLVPWLGVAAIARRFRSEPNQIATYKVFPALVLYPATWAAEAFLALRELGSGLAAAAVALVAPLSGWIAMRWHERRDVLWRESRAFLFLHGRKRVAGELAARRGAVEREIERLIELWRALQPEGSPPASPASSSSRA